MPGAFTLGTLPSNSPKGSSFQAIQPTVTPVGVIHMFAGSTSPVGWLICDGSTVSRSTYSALFAVIGTTYGSGDGNTTFTLPDLRGRVPIGAGTGAGLTNRVLGTQYGAETVTLDSTSLPTHSHANTVSGGSTGAMSANASHSHSATKSYWHNSGSAAYTFTGGSSAIGLDTPTTDSKNLDHTHTFTPSISNANAGSGGSHANIPPVLTLNYIIKV